MAKRSVEAERQASIYGGKASITLVRRPATVSALSALIDASLDPDPQGLNDG